MSISRYYPGGLNVGTQIIGQMAWRLPEPYPARPLEESLGNIGM